MLVKSIPEAIDWLNSLRLEAQNDREMRDALTKFLASFKPTDIDVYMVVAEALKITRKEAKEMVLRQAYGGQNIANETWRKGFVHLTVDHNGVVSLWDNEMQVDSYLKLPLTHEQVELIEETRQKGGHTP